MEGSLSFTPGFNRVTEGSFSSSNRFNGFWSLVGEGEPLKRLSETFVAVVTRLKPGVNGGSPRFHRKLDVEVYPRFPQVVFNERV